MYVPAGEFKMGSDEGSDDEKPVHTVYLDAFWMDQTEVTNEMFSKYVDATGYETYAEKAGESWVVQNGEWRQVDGANWNHPGGPGSVISGIEAHPVVHISWTDAKAYCEWRGARLPTEAEWEKAASWDDDRQEKRVYPWGSSVDCRYANYWGKAGGCVGGTTKVGSYPSGVSFYGLLDMAGNVWEWVLDWYDPSYYDKSPTSNPMGSASGDSHVLRGGSWNLDDSVVRSSDRSAIASGSSGDGAGFRCSRSLP
jgi:formylglycine-generating enzyme required for sulfatase activity